MNREKESNGEKSNADTIRFWVWLKFERYVALGNKGERNKNKNSEAIRKQENKEVRKRERE